MRFASQLLALVVSGATLTGSVPAGPPEPVVLDAHRSWVYQVAFSPSGKLLLSVSSDDEAVVVWNLETRKKQATLRAPSTCYAATMSPDGKLIAAGTSEDIQRPGPILSTPSLPTAAAKIFDAESGKEVVTVTEGRVLTNPVHSVIFAPDGKTLAFGSCNPRVTDKAEETQVVIWNIEKKRITDVHKLDSGDVYGLAYSPDGKLLAAASSDRQAGLVTVWDVTSGKVKLRMTNKKCPLMSVCFSPDGKTLAFGGGIYANPFENPPRPKVAALSLWDLAKEKELASLDDVAEPVRWVAFSGDGKVLASAGGDQVEDSGELILWDVAAKKHLVCVKQSDAGLTSGSFGPKGKMLATGASNGKIKIWDVDELLRKSP